MAKSVKQLRADIRKLKKAADHAASVAASVRFYIRQPECRGDFTLPEVVATEVISEIARALANACSNLEYIVGEREVSKPEAAR